MAFERPAFLDPNNGYVPTELPSNKTLDPTSLGTGGTSDTDVLHKDGTWSPEGGVGNGNVVGPSGSTTHALPRFADDTGLVLDETPIVADDNGNLTNVGTINGRVVENDGEALDDHLAASAPHAGHATLAGGKVPDAELPNDIARGPGPTVTDRAVAVFDGTGGVQLDESGVTIAPDGSISSPGGLQVGTDLEVAGDADVTGDIAVGGTVDGVDVAALKATVDALVGAGGSGDVVGPASSTDNRLVRMDGTTGKLIQQSAITVDDSGNITGAGTFNTVNVDALPGADVTLQANIDAEEAARIAADDAEEAARIAADSAEAVARAAADASEASTRATADTSEAVARAAADSAHAALTDPHTGVLSLDGGRQMTGDLDMGAQDIVDVNLVDGRDVAADGLITDEVPAIGIAASSIGIFTPEMGLPGLGRPVWEQVICEYTEAVATSIVTDFVKQESVSLGGSAIDTTAKTITHADHRHFAREQVKYTGVAGTGLSAAVQYYVKNPTKNTYQLSTFADLSDTVNLTGNNAALAVTRYKWFYQDAAGGSDEFYVPIGLPLDSGTHRYPSDSRFWDAGADLPPLGVAVGGAYYVRLEVTVYNDTGEDRNVMLVIDPDPNVRACGYVGADVGVATVTGSPTSDITLTAHGLLNHDFVYVYPNGSTAMPSPLVVNVGWWVKYVDANTFQLCSDAALTTPVSLVTDSTMGVRRVPYGSKYAIRACCVIPSGSTTRTPAVWEMWGVNVGGNAAANVATENMHHHSRLTIDQNAVETNPATANSGAVYHQGFRRSRPAKANSVELNRYDWGPKSRLWYFDAAPAFTYAAGATITGGTSGATGKVVAHDLKRKTVLYKKTSGELDFIAGETITDGSNTLEIGMCERGPIPDKLGIRVAVSGADVDPLFVELNVQHITVAVGRKATT